MTQQGWVAASECWGPALDLLISPTALCHVWQATVWEVWGHEGQWSSMGPAFPLVFEDDPGACGLHPLAHRKWTDMVSKVDNEDVVMSY